MRSVLVCALPLLAVPGCLAAIGVGRALSVFPAFGDLGPVLVAAEPQLEDVNWAMDPDAVDVFENINATWSEHFRSPGSDFGGDFQLELCDDFTQLQAAMFRVIDICRCTVEIITENNNDVLDRESELIIRPFSVEGVDRPWRLFSGGWGRAAAALKLGLRNSSYVVPGQYAYALATLTRPRVTVSLSPDSDLRVNNRTRDLLASLPLVEGEGQEREGEALQQLLKEIGSHYVAAYTTGETLHQVFVFATKNYREIEHALWEYQRASQDIEQILDMFDSRHVEHFGKIVSSSNNATLEWWLAWTLGRSSLLSLSQQPDLLRRLDRMLGTAATVVSADLRSLPSALGAGYAARRLKEALDNRLRLWEINV